MKIRYGFVSNSSSSSFTCDVCKETVELYNGESDNGVYLTCEAGHSICGSHVKNKPTIGVLRESAEKAAKESYKDSELENELKEIEGMDKNALEEYITEIYGCDLPSASCPLCQFTTLPDDDLLDYLLMLTGSTKKSMIESALTNYKSLGEFEAAIKKHKQDMKAQGKK